MRSSFHHGLEKPERSRDHLIHIVISVLREPSGKDNVRELPGFRLVPLVQGMIELGRNGVQRFAVGGGILSCNAGVRMPLARTVFPFTGSCEWCFLVAVIDLGDRLEIFLVDGLMFEAERTVREPPVHISEKLVNGTRENQVPVGSRRHILEIRIRAERDVIVRKHVPEQFGVARGGHELVKIGKISVVAVRADRQPPADARGQMFRFLLPLFFRVPAEKRLEEFDSDMSCNDFLGIGDARMRDALSGEEILRFFVRCQSQIEKCVEGIPIDRDLKQGASNIREHPVGIRNPIRKTTEVLHDASIVRMKQMRPVVMEKDAAVVSGIEGIPSKMKTPVDYEDLFPALGCKAFREHASRESRADYKVVECH
jgi:hypothetical protein